MQYKCSVCHEMVEGDLVSFQDHTNDHIIDVIKERHPEWVEDQGICTKCEEYFRKQLRGK